MLKFYYNGSPNPTKVALFLEEAGLAYEAIPIDTRKGDQFKPEFLAINPNGKVPAIVADGVTRPLTYCGVNAFSGSAATGTPSVVIRLMSMRVATRPTLIRLEPSRNGS